MNNENSELRDYLLGALPQGPAEDLDARLFHDGKLTQKLAEEQELLIEDFVERRLSVEQEALFEAQCARSPELLGRVESLRSLMKLLEVEAASRGPERSYRFLSKLLLFAAPVFAALLLVAALLFYRAAHNNTGMSRQTQAISKTRQPDASSAGGASRLTTVVFLSALNLRGTASVASFHLPATPQAVELQVEVHASPSFDGNFQVELSTGSRIIQSFANVPLHRIGPIAYLSLLVESKELLPGSYLVRYAETAGIAKFEKRQFRVVAGR